MPRWLEAQAEAAVAQARGGGTGAVVAGGARAAVAKVFGAATTQAGRGSARGRAQL